MATKKPLVVTTGTVQQVSAADTIDPITLGVGTPTIFTLLRGDGKWGTVSFVIRAVTTTASITAADSIITADATGAAFTITLPDATTYTGTEFTVKKIDASANIVTIATSPGTQTIDGVTTKTISTQWTSVSVVSNGANWLII